MADTKVVCEKLLTALRCLVGEPASTAERKLEFPGDLLSANKVILSPRQAFFSEQESVEFSNSVGKVAGETIAFYPPGVPVLCPGELITRDLIDSIKKQQSAGRRVVGPRDTTLKYISVIKN